MAFVGMLFRFGTGDESAETIIVVIVFGMTLSLSWYITIHSYAQLNYRKFTVLQEFEKVLPFPFFTREWEVRASYWRLSKVETYDPVAFLPLFIALEALLRISEGAVNGQDLPNLPLSIEDILTMEYANHAFSTMVCV